MTGQRPASLTDLAPRLDEDEAAWLARELAEHPDNAGRILDAVAAVHDLHLAGGCS